MKKWYAFLLLFSLVYASKGQETTLPVDLRQHNLTEFNSSLFNPVFSLDRNRPQSIAFWSRWQWQAIDSDPTTLFLNYSRSLNSKSAISVGYFQNNTEIFLKTGGVLNYAYSFDLGKNTRLAVGLNVFGFQQEFTNPVAQPDPPLPLPELDMNNSFIMQFAPGIRFTSNGFGIGIASENLFDYNFKNKEAETLSSEKVYIGMMSYDVPLTLGVSLESAFLQPNVYLKTIPNEDTQFGMNMLLSTSKFWAQTGYNNFYGIGVGGGGRFFQKLSLGALVEFGTSSEMKDNDPSFELIAAYGFGKQGTSESAVAEEDSEILPLEENAEKTKEEKVRDRLAKTEAVAAEKEAKKMASIEAKQRKVFLKDSLDRAKKQERLAGTEKLKEQQRQDSINKNKELEVLAAQQQLQEEKRLDSLRNIQLAEEAAIKKAAEEKLATDNEQPKTQGRYEEVQKQDGLIPGYYLVANVFGTKKYFDNFMTTLKAKGLAPKSFYRAVNKYNYVYLERYDSLREAEIARDNQFGGKYLDKTWIFRVVEE